MSTRQYRILATLLVLGISFAGLLQATGLRLPGRPGIALAGTMTPDQSGGSSGLTQNQAGSASTPTQVVSATAQASGTVLASDNFSNPSTGLFSTTSPDPAWIFGYTNGDYQMTSTGNVALADESAFSQGGATWADVSIAVDAHLMSDADSGDSMGVACRISGQGSSLTGYRAYIDPANAEFNVQRIDNGKFVDLSGAKSSGLTPMQFSPFHIQLLCAGTTITATINGKQVYTAQDGAYGQGGVALLAHMFHRTVPNAPTAAASDLGKIDVRFDNFVVSQP